MRVGMGERDGGAWVGVQRGSVSEGLRRIEESVFGG